MNRITHLMVALIFVLTSILTAAPPMNAQGSDTLIHTSELTGLTLEVLGATDARINPDFSGTQRFPRYTQEDILIQHGEAEIWINFVDGTSYMDAWVSDSLDDMERWANNVIFYDQEFTDEYLWYFMSDARTITSGVVYSYHEANEDFSDGFGIGITIYSDGGNILDEITWVDEMLRIDGQSPLVQVDFGHLEALYNDTSNIEPVYVPDTTYPISHWEDEGLISESEWITPGSDLHLTWNTAELEFPTERTDVSLVPSGRPLAELPLATPDRSGYLWMYVGPWEGVFDGDLEQWLTILVSDEWVEAESDQPGRELEVLRWTIDETVGSIIYREHYYGTERITIWNYSINDDGILIATELYAAPHALVATYAAFADGLTVNGEPLSLALTIQDIENLVADLDSGASTGSVADDSASQAERPDRTASSQDADSTTTGRTSRTTSSESVESVIDWQPLGLISDSEWRGPISGISFSWDTDLWIFPVDVDDAIELGESFESITLQTPDNRGEVVIMVDHDGYGTDVWFEAITDPDTFTDEQGRGMTASIVDSKTTDATVGSIVLMDSSEEQLVMIVDVWVNEDGLTLVTMIAAAPEDIADVYADFWEGVRSNGDYYPLTWEIEEIEALGN